jgi:hypothetical protein
VEAHTRAVRGSTLLDLHSKEKGKDKGRKGGKEVETEPDVIWDHARDMSLGGRLMDDKKREGLVRDAKNLGDRFGVGRGGAFDSGRS